MDYAKQRALLNEAIGRYEGQEFGLRAFPGDRFRLAPRYCYTSDRDSEGHTRPILVYEVLQKDGSWAHFSKADEVELLQEMTPLKG